MSDKNKFIRVPKEWLVSRLRDSVAKELYDVKNAKFYAGQNTILGKILGGDFE